MNDSLDISSGRYLSERAVRNHALRCSAQFRAGKFTRVGQDFLDEVKGDVEAVLRELRNKVPSYMHDPLLRDETFITGLFDQRAASIFNDLIGRIIQNKVQRQPSCGMTLSRTR
jgi:hypothetical protein